MIQGSKSDVLSDLENPSMALFWLEISSQSGCAWRPFPEICKKTRDKKKMLLTSPKQIGFKEPNQTWQKNKICYIPQWCRLYKTSWWNSKRESSVQWNVFYLLWLSFDQRITRWWDPWIAEPPTAAVYELVPKLSLRVMNSGTGLRDGVLSAVSSIPPPKDLSMTWKLLCVCF